MWFIVYFLILVAEVNPSHDPRITLSMTTPTNNEQAPTFNSDHDAFEDYQARVIYWSLGTAVAAAKQGPTLLRHLSGLAFDIGKQLKITSLVARNNQSCDDLGFPDVEIPAGVHYLLTALNKAFKPEKRIYSVRVLKNLFSCTRRNEEKMVDFTTRFSTCWTKASSCGITMSEATVALLLLGNAGLEESQYPPVYSYVGSEDDDMTFTKMQQALNFLHSSHQPTVQVPTQVLSAVTNTQDITEAFKDASIDDGTLEEFEVYECKNEGTDQEGYFARKFFIPRSQHSRGLFSNSSNTQRQQTRSTPPSTIYNNPRYRTCFRCGQDGHWARDCSVNKHTSPYTGLYPIRYVQIPEVFTQKLSDTTNLQNSSEKETLNSTIYGILDSGCTMSVVGDSLLNSLGEQHDIKFSPSNVKFLFGRDMRTAQQEATLSVTIGGCPHQLKLQVIKDQAQEPKLPLLLSRSFMAHIGLVIDFSKSQGSLRGKSINFKQTSGGHYLLPIQVNTVESAFTSTTINAELMRVHKQLGHPSTERLLRTLQICTKSQLPSDIRTQLNNIQQNCITCHTHTKPSSHMKSSLPLANDFNEILAIDIMYLNKTPILKMVDIYTHLTVAHVLQDKSSQAVVSALIIFF